MKMKQISADKKNAAWEHDRWFKRWIDLPTVFVCCCWGGMLLLWPDLSPQNKGVISRYKSMVVAHDMAFSNKDLYLRPDLVAMPSIVSFMPCIDDENVPILPNKKETHTCMLKRGILNSSIDTDSDGVALAAEAIRNVGRGRERRSEVGSRRSENKREVGRGVFVCVSPNIGDDVILDWTEADKASLFDGSSGWEVELSLAIGDRGLPQSVFLEKSSGDDLIDKGIVHALSRYDIWKNVLPGYGTVLISFSPKVQ